MNPSKDQLPVIYVAQPVIGELEARYVQEAIQRGEVSSLGSFVTEFEERFAKRVGAAHGIATCNGTAALHLALLAAGIGPGDEVIVPSLTFVATANVVKYVDASPVFVDIESNYWGLDYSAVRSAITSRTKAIIPVHLYGHPVDMDPIMSLADEHDLVVIEDAAEAHGAEYKGRPVGSIGHVGIFSFYGNKIMTTGEGGIVVTNDEMVAQRAKQYRDHGSDPVRRYWHPVIGYNYRMTNLQAALGLAQLEQLEGFLERKREISALYRSLMSEIPGIEFQAEESWASPVSWMVSILVGPEKRDELMQRLDEKSIEVRPFFYPLHTLPPYQDITSNCPVAEEVSSRGINLPSGVPLTDKDVERVANAVSEFCLKDQQQA